MNRCYRKWVDQRLKQRYQLVDFLFPLAPVNAVNRLQKICSVAREAVIEVETHPVNHEEFRFLTSGELGRLVADLQVSVGFAAAMRNKAA